MQVSCQNCGYVTAPVSASAREEDAWQQARPEMCPHCGQARLVATADTEGAA